MDSASLLAWCRKKNVTVNSLLMQNLILTFEHWRNRKGFTTAKELQRICVPINLRTNDCMTIANSMSFMLIDHKNGSSSPGALLEHVQAQVHSPDRDLRLSFNVLIRVGRCFPGGVRGFLGSQNCWATAIFSNLGRVLDGFTNKSETGHAVAGNVTLEDWELLPPLHDNVSLTVCSSSYAGKLKVLFYHDTNDLGENDAQELWELFFKMLRQTVDLPRNDTTATEQADELISFNG